MVFADMLRDVLIEIHTRRARTVLLVAAIALSVGSLVASLSISRMAAVQIDTDLAATATRTIVISRAAGDDGSGGSTFPDDADELVAGLDLVEAAGMRVELTSRTTVTVRRSDPVQGEPAEGLTVAGLSSGYVEAVQAGLVPTAWTLDGTDHIVMLGTTAAQVLDIPVSDDPTGYGIWINQQRYQVVGFLTGAEVTATTVAVPYATAVEILGDDGSATLTVLTAPGGAGPVAAVVRTAVRPDAPAALATSIVVEAAEVRRGVATQLDRLVAGIGWLLLALTMLLIANSMVVSVMSRTPEIGLRRAMGASRRRIAGLVLCEGAAVGLLGGLVGAATAALIVVGTAIVNGWTARLDIVLLGAAPLLGWGVAALASLYPALRAAGVEPATAVRSD